MVQTGTDARCWGPYGNRKLPTGVLGLWWGEAPPRFSLSLKTSPGFH